MATTTVEVICTALAEFAPLQLAEDWDNVGLLVGDRQDEVHRVMTCLTITPRSAEEAIGRHASIIVTHHPLPFRPLKRITADTVPGTLLWKLIRAGIAVYSPHTSFDSAARGINDRLANGLALTGIEPLEPAEVTEAVGAGRCGSLSAPVTMEALANRLKAFLRVERLKLVGESTALAERVAVACGAAGQFLDAARAKGCDVLVTGETNFHTCLAAEATGMKMLLPGHFPSERFAVESLADMLAKQFPQLEIWASEMERDPITWL